MCVFVHVCTCLNQSERECVCVREESERRVSETK